MGYAIRNVQLDQEKLEQGERRQCLFCTDDEQRVGENFSSVQKNTDFYQLQNGGVSLEGNAEKIKFKYLVMSRLQNSG